MPSHFYSVKCRFSHLIRSVFSTRALLTNFMWLIVISHFAQQTAN